MIGDRCGDVAVGFAPKVGFWVVYGELNHKVLVLPIKLWWWFAGLDKDCQRY
jgi:hypothetical protein